MRGCRRKARGVGAKVVRGELPLGGEVAADQSTTEHAVGRDRDAQITARRQDLGLDAAGDQRVLDLHVADRVGVRRATDRLGTDLRQPDVTDEACVDELGDRAHGLLDRHLGVQARGAIDVDVVDAETRQRMGHCGLDGWWTAS